MRDLGAKCSSSYQFITGRKRGRRKRDSRAKEERVRTPHNENPSQRNKKNGLSVLKQSTLMGLGLFKIGLKNPVVIWTQLLPDPNSRWASGYSILNGLF